MCSHGVTIETSADTAPTTGSHTLLLQMTTNLLHNAIVHNLAEQGTVWVTTSVHPTSAVVIVENTGEKFTPQLVSTLVEPFQRGTGRIRTDHAGVGLGLAIVKSITQAHDGTRARTLSHSGRGEERPLLFDRLGGTLTPRLTPDRIRFGEAPGGR